MTSNGRSCSWAKSDFYYSSMPVEENIGIFACMLAYHKVICPDKGRILVRKNVTIDYQHGDSFLISFGNSRL
ncbi:hypothetical protein COLO4_02301 [Corchorus olitorius]|uniref:Uncharacterized protein n=1 Tax=Corchorus olitorius TaxID=93759 RepID=A0A1R3L1B5_9ROSI|nr:hypothetical protein COLO4_02301 [Corchorus olitorius]